MKVKILAFISTLSVVGIALLYLLSTDAANYQEISTNQNVNRHTFLLRFTNLVLITATIKGSHNTFTGKHGNFKSPKRNGKGFNLSLFKGREAKLNHVILLILFQDSPLVVYDITKTIKKYRGFKFTRYTNVNRRVRALTQQGYIETVGSRKTQSGVKGILYQPTIRAKAAFYFNAINPDQFIKEATDEALTTEIAAFALFFEDQMESK